MPVPPASGGRCGAHSPARAHLVAAAPRRAPRPRRPRGRAPLVREHALVHERAHLLEPLGRRSPCGRRHGSSIARHEMRLASTWGRRDEPARAARARAGGRAARVRLGVDGGSLGHRRGHAARVARRATTTHRGSAARSCRCPARSPANAAMTAVTLDMLSGGRVLLGLGTSGPQVVEGWHGQAWGKPLGKTREYVEIVRAILRRERLEHHGEHYDIPVQGGTGLGKPLKMMVHPLRNDVPIYLAAIGPKTVALTAEIADGWLPIFFSPERARDVSPLEPRARGLRHRAARAGARDRRRAGGRDFMREYSRSTSAAWAHAARTSTTISSRATATRPRRTRSRSSTSAARARGGGRCPTRSSTRSRSSARSSGSPTGSPRGGKAAPRRCSSRRATRRRYGPSPKRQLVRDRPAAR